jgi:hypothetical protein
VKTPNQYSRGSYLGPPTYETNVNHLTMTFSVICYKGVSKSFRTESVMKYMLTTINTHWEATQRVMVAKLPRLTQNSNTTALSGREMYHLQFLLKAASPETFGYTLVSISVWLLVVYGGNVKYMVKERIFMHNTLLNWNHSLIMSLAVWRHITEQVYEYKANDNIPCN